MPTARIATDLEMYYQIDDFTDPWREPETIVLLHGNSENGDVWYGWVPHLARRYRVVRPDMRGFGRSTAMPRDYSWSLDGIINDYVTLLSGLGVKTFHLVGAKIGATIALRFAARHPEMVKTLTVLGGIASGHDALGDRAQSWFEHLEQKGVESWARWTMPGRLGEKFPAAGAEWWAQLMGKTPLSSQLGFIPMVPCINLAADLPHIQCPTLVVASHGAGLASVADTRVWQEKIPRSELIPLAGDSYHVAATEPDRYAKATVEFIQRSAD